MALGVHRPRLRGEGGHSRGTTFLPSLTRDIRNIQKGREGVPTSGLEFKHMAVGMSQTLLGKPRMAEDEPGEEAECKS